MPGTSQRRRSDRGEPTAIGRPYAGAEHVAATRAPSRVAGIGRIAHELRAVGAMPAAMRGRDAVVRRAGPWASRARVS